MKQLEMQQEIQTATGSKPTAERRKGRMPIPHKKILPQKKKLFNN